MKGVNSQKKKPLLWWFWMSHKRLDTEIYPVSPGSAHAGVWMYGGVPDISQKTVPYINDGDNIFFDVSPVYLPVCKLSGHTDEPLWVRAALLLDTAGAVGAV